MAGVLAFPGPPRPLISADATVHCLSLLCVGRNAFANATLLYPDAQRRETRGEHGAAAARKGQPESAKEFGSKTPWTLHDIPPIWMFKRLNTLAIKSVTEAKIKSLPE